MKTGLQRIEVTTSSAIFFIHAVYNAGWDNIVDFIADNIT